jgi:hypothetical protein
MNCRRLLSSSGQFHQPFVAVAKSTTGRLPIVLLSASLALIALLSSKLWDGREENLRLAEEKKALIGRIAEMNRRFIESDTSLTKSSGERMPELDAEIKRERDASVADWQKKYAPFRHRDLLRIIWIRYHEAIALLNLPRDEHAQLLELLCEREETSLDAMDVARAAGITDPKEIKKATDAARSAVSEEIDGLIGAPALESLEDSVALKTQEIAIDRNVGVDLAMGGIALTQDQETGLAQIYVDLSKKAAAASLSASNPASSDISSQPPSVVVQRQSEDDAYVLGRAAAILTPEQMVVLKSYLDWSNQRTLVSLEIPK